MVRLFLITIGIMMMIAGKSHCIEDGEECSLRDGEQVQSESSCRFYYQCLRNGRPGGKTFKRKDCPARLFYSSTYKICTWSWDVKGECNIDGTRIQTDIVPTVIPADPTTPPTSATASQTPLTDPTTPSTKKQPAQTDPIVQPTPPAPQPVVVPGGGSIEPVVPGGGSIEPGNVRTEQKKYLLQFCNTVINGTSPFVAYPGKCNQFIQCVFVFGEFMPHIGHCGGNKYWHISREACRPKEEVLDCDGNGVRLDGVVTPDPFATTTSAPVPTEPPTKPTPIRTAAHVCREFFQRLRDEDRLMAETLATILSTVQSQQQLIMQQQAVLAQAGTKIDTVTGYVTEIKNRLNVVYGQIKSN